MSVAAENWCMWCGVGRVVYWVIGVLGIGAFRECTRVELCHCCWHQMGWVIYDVSFFIFLFCQKRSQNKLNWDLETVAGWGSELDGRHEFHGWGHLGQSMGASCELS